MDITPAIITVGLNPAIDRVIEAPNFVLGAHQRVRVLRRAPAGKSVNVARVLAALGVPNVHTGFVGADSRVEFKAVFNPSLVRDEMFAVPGRTRENITIVDPAAHQETHLRDAGLEVDRRDLARLKSKLGLMARDGQIVAFSGSLPPGVGAEAFVELIDVCRHAGARVAVDTSGEALSAAVQRKLWLVKPNAAELATLAGRELPDRDAQIAAARELTGRVELVLLTAGAEGAMLFSPRGAWRACAPIEPERVVNTVGCGDALLGAFIAGVWRGRALPDCLAAAVATATASACTALPAEFDAGLAGELTRKIELSELKD